MAETAAAPNNKAISFKAKPGREPSGAAKKSMVRKRAKKAVTRGLISEKAARRHLPDL